MKSPRRIDLNDEVLAQFNLSTAPPPSGALFWSLWSSCTQIAQQALETAFIQGIKAGTLDPIRYGGFNVNDAYYCYKGAADYLAAAHRAADPALRAALTAKHNSYKKYNATFPSTWRIHDASGIIPFDVCKEYSEFETHVATSEDPVYSLVVMLPCEYLWYWLAEQLGAPAPQNLYAAWVTGNNSPHGAYVLGNLLESYQQAYPGALDPEKARQIYARAMQYEQQNFAAAMGSVT